MIGVIRQVKAIPKRLQNPPYTPPFCKLIYKHQFHPLCSKRRIVINKIDNKPKLD